MKFEELIKELHVLAEKNANIAEVKEEVIRVMESYKSNKDDWKKYAHFSAQRYKENDQKKHTIKIVMSAFDIMLMICHCFR